MARAEKQIIRLTRSRRSHVAPKTEKNKVDWQ